MSKFIRSPPGKYSITKYRFYRSWKEHFNPTTQGLFYELAKTFLYYLDWTTLFLKIISDFFSFLTATGSPVFIHLQSLTYPKAPFPIILMDGKSLMDSFTLYCLKISAYSCKTFFLISSCYLVEMPSICIFRFSCYQYYFFSCSCIKSLEYRCSIKLLAASTFSFVILEITISFGLSLIQIIIF